MWIVVTNEEGLIGVYENYSEAFKEYEEQREALDEYCLSWGEYDGEERVVLAKVERQYYSYDTKEPTKEDNETTYWDIKEDIY